MLTCWFYGPQIYGLIGGMVHDEAAVQKNWQISRYTFILEIGDASNLVLKKIDWEC